MEVEGRDDTALNVDGELFESASGKFRFDLQPAMFRVFGEI